MKFSLLLLSLFSAASFAHGSSHPPQNGTDSGQVMSYTEVPRSLTFWSDRNATSKEGYILVCPEPFKSNSYDNTCLDSKGQNAWSTLDTVTPGGFDLRSYEYRFVGSSGYRILILYFGLKQVAVAQIGPVNAPAAASNVNGGQNQSQTVNATSITIKADKVIVERKRK